jgi:hypothetical protein
MKERKENNMKVLLKHAEKFLKAVDDFEKNEIDIDGKMVRSEEAFSKLDDLLRKGLKFHNEVIEKKLYEKFPILNVILSTIKEYTNKIQATEEAAKKLTLENSIVIWQQLETALAVLASYVIDFLALDEQ